MDQVYLVLLLEELYSLLVQNARLETQIMDFVVELLETIGFDIVITIVNSVSKRVYL